MSVLNRYIARKFWAPFFFVMGIFTILAFLADLFDHIKYISQSQAELRVVIKYFLHSVPAFTLMSVPVGCLLAVLFALSNLTASGEYLAAKASGYSPAKLISPIMFCVAVVLTANFAVSSYWGPKLYRDAKSIYKREITGKTNWRSAVKKDITIKTSQDAILTAVELDSDKGILTRPVIIKITGGKTDAQIDAEKGQWTGKRWVFINGVSRFLENGLLKSERPFKKIKTGLSISPKNLAMEDFPQEQLTLSELLGRIRVLRQTNSPRHREMTYLHIKLSAPLNGFLICLMAVPFVLRSGKTNKMLCFSGAMAVSFLFWWLISIGQSAGSAQMLSPIIAGWAPSAIMAVLSFAAFKLSGNRI